MPLTPLRHVPAAIPLRLENQYFSLDVSHPLATEMLQSGTCMFYVRGCSVSLNLNFCGTTNVNEPKRGNAASIDIDALLQNTWLQVISLRHGPQFRDEEGYTLWQRCIADVERVQHELKASGLDDASCQHILTASARCSMKP